jgi:MFS family permease
LVGVVPTGSLEIDMTPPGSIRQLRAARISITYVFFAVGAIFGNWVTRIPAIKAKLALSNPQLGLALFMCALASVLMLPLAGWLIARFGSRRTTILGFLGVCASIAVIAFTTDSLVFGLCLFVLGGIMAVQDVAMNAHGIAVERRYGRPILSSMHAWFSIGGLVGALSGALAARAALDLRWHFLLGAGLAAAGGVVAGRFLLPGADEAPPEKRRFAWPPRQLQALGLVAFACLLAEGAAADWSAVYIHEPLAASSAVAALGYAAFSLAMVIGRLGGDRLTERVGPVTLTRLGGALASGSLALGLLANRPLAAILGFIGMGLGLSTIVPTVFRAAGSRPDIAPGIGLASVSTLGYSGFLVGPALIGTLSKLVGLPAALGVVVALMAVIAVLASSTAPALGVGETPALAAEEEMLRA